MDQFNQSMSAEYAVLQQIFFKAFSAIPFNQMLGLRLDRLSHDHAEMSFAMKPELIGNFLQGILHGGVISSVLDMAGGMIAMAAAAHKKSIVAEEGLIALLSKSSTVDLQISYLRPGRGHLFVATADLLRSGNLLSFTRMSLHNQDHDLIAAGTGTYLLK